MKKECPWLKKIPKDFYSIWYVVCVRESLSTSKGRWRWKVNRSITANKGGEILVEQYRNAAQ